MSRLFSIFLLSTLALACGSNAPSQKTWTLTLLEMGAWEDERQWDLFDDRPELYTTFEMGSETYRSSSKTHGAWVRPLLSESFTFHSSSNLLVVEVLDNDHGEDDDLDEDQDSLFDALVFGLVNDADDQVLKASVNLPEGSGILQLKNDRGYLLLDYHSH